VRLVADAAAHDALQARAEAAGARLAEMEARDAEVWARDQLERARDAALAVVPAEPGVVLVPRQMLCAACPPYRTTTPPKAPLHGESQITSGGGGGSGAMAAKHALRAELAKLQLAHANELASAMADKAAAERRAGAATTRAGKLSNELAELKKAPSATPAATAAWRPASATGSRRNSAAATPQSVRQAAAAADPVALRTEASVRDLERRLADMSKAREESQAARAAAERDVLAYKHALALAEEQIKSGNPEEWRQGVVPTSKHDAHAEQLLKMAKMQLEIEELTAALSRAPLGGTTASDAEDAGRR
jgi:hypothetical protein